MEFFAYPCKSCFDSSYIWVKGYAQPTLRYLGYQDSQWNTPDPESFFPSKEYFQRQIEYTSTLDRETKTALQIKASGYHSTLKGNRREGDGVLISRAIANAPVADKPFVVMTQYKPGGFIVGYLDWEKEYMEKDEVLLLEVPVGTKCIYVPNESGTVILSKGTRVELLPGDNMYKKISRGIII